MRRALVGLILVGVMVSATPAVAQDSPARQFIEVVGGSDIADALGAWGANITGSAERERLRAAIATDRSGLAGVVPDACTLPTYVGYLEALTYADVALRLFEDFQFEAATTVQGMITDKIQSLDPQDIAGCL